MKMASIYMATGNLGAPAQLKNVGSGLITFNLAVTTGWGDNKATHWLKCDLWGKRANEKMAALLDTGTRCLITGELSQQQYKRNDGTVSQTLVVNVDKLEIFPKPENKSGYADTPAPPTTPPPDEEKFNDFDDIPF